jgi:hypothetical protein
MQECLLMLMLVGAPVALAATVFALLLRNRQRLAFALLCLGAFWGTLSSVGGFLFASYFRVLHDRGKSVDYVFDTRKSSEGMAWFGIVTLLVTLAPYFYIHRTCRTRRESNARN